MGTTLPVASTLDAGLRVLTHITSPYTARQLYAGIASGDISAKTRRITLGMKNVTRDELDSLTRDEMTTLKQAILVSTAWSEAYKQGRNLTHVSVPEME